MKHENSKVTMVVNQIALRCANFEAQFIMAKLEAEELAEKSKADIQELRNSLEGEKRRRVVLQDSVAALANSKRAMTKNLRETLKLLSLD
jgi:uncharacterized protein involved in exopolysaccharide biosynthesis